MNYRFAKLEDLPEVTTLLELCKLQANDLEKHNFLVALDQDRVVGCIGLEADVHLLRSLAVYPSFREKGVAKKLCTMLFKYAVEIGIRELYLLTVSAEKFFLGQGFETIPREKVPESIRSHQQFTMLCPTSAVVMRKDLTAP